MPEPIAGAVITIRRAKILLKRGWHITDTPHCWLDAHPYRELAGQADTALTSKWDLEEASLIPKSADD